MKFWKSTKRIRAVKKSEYRKQRPFSGDSSSDSDFETPPLKRMKTSVEDRLKKLEDGLQENTALKIQVIEAQSKEKQLKDVQSRYREM